MNYFTVYHLKCFGGLYIFQNLNPDIMAGQELKSLRNVRTIIKSNSKTF